MRVYLDLLRNVREHGVPRTDRTEVGTVAVFGRQLRFDLAAGFPLVTTKRVHLKSMIHELLWFLRGDSNIAYLHEHGVRIWDEWADKNGDLGPVYGAQWRRWCDSNGNEHDQVANLIHMLRNDPMSRRMMISSWNVGELDAMRLAPCHVLAQVWVNDGKLSLQLYQRSADMFLGVPFNIASYALLAHLLAHVCELGVGEFIHTFGDTHIYQNHFAQVDKQLQRAPRNLPSLQLNPDVHAIGDFCYGDIQIKGYDPHPRLPATVAV